MHWSAKSLVPLALGLLGTGADSQSVAPRAGAPSPRCVSATTRARAAVDAPAGIRFVQWAEGQVMLTTNSGLPQNASHYRVYLSSVQGQQGGLAATVTLIDYPDGPSVFNAPKGRMFFATVHGYNSLTDCESTNTDQHQDDAYTPIQGLSGVILGSIAR